MRLAAEGKNPKLLGEIRGMHDAYEFVKEKSPWIGPNVSYVLSFFLILFVFVLGNPLKKATNQLDFLLSG